MGEKVFFLSGRDRCAQVYQHECKIYKHVCKTDRGAAVQKSAKICKNLQNLQNLQNMQSALTNSKRGAYTTTTCPHLSLALTSSWAMPLSFLESTLHSKLMGICSGQTQFETNLQFLRICSSQQFLRICSSQTQFETNLQDSDVVTGWFVWAMPESLRVSFWFEPTWNC